MNISVLVMIYIIGFLSTLSYFLISNFEYDCINRRSLIIGLFWFIVLLYILFLFFFELCEFIYNKITKDKENN